MRQSEFSRVDDAFPKLNTRPFRKPRQRLAPVCLGIATQYIMYKEQDL
jgi:hypothetical protein